MYNSYINNAKGEYKMNTTMVTYSNKLNPFDQVLIKSDDSFVIVGDSNPSDSELLSMSNWEDVKGWNAK